MRGATSKKNRIYFHSCEIMEEVEDHSASLIILSPPFTDNPDQIHLSKASYLLFLGRVLNECNRILKPSGTLVTVNTDLRDHEIYNNGDKRYEGTVWFKHADIRIAAEQNNFKCVEQKIWIKSLKVSLYRYNFATIIFFQKKGHWPSRPAVKRRNLEFLCDVWLLEKGAYRKSLDGFVFRNAIHPVIVERCVDEFTNPGELVVSPFSGSGTILAVAEMMGRRWIGYETDEKLTGLIKESIYGPKRPHIYSKIEKRYIHSGRMHKTPKSPLSETLNLKN